MVPSSWRATATWKVLHSVTAHARLSDKGRLAHRIGERSAHAVLLQPGVFQLVSHLTTPRSKELRRELARLRSDGRGESELIELASQWGGRTQRRHRSIGDLRAVIGDEAYEGAELLATEDWVERGFEIQCDQCTIRSFVPIKDVGPAAVCPACEASQVFKRSRGPDLFYRLNGLVDRASDQGVLPHILAADVLARRNPSTHLLLGVDVEFHDGHRAEVDLFGLHGGRVVAGEAKTSPTEFSVEQLQRDADISQRLGAEAHVIASPHAIGGELVERGLSSPIRGWVR